MSKRMILAAAIAATSLTLSGSVWVGAADQGVNQGADTSQTPADHSSQNGRMSQSNTNSQSSGQNGMDQSRSDQQRSEQSQPGQELAQTEQQSIRKTLAMATDAVLSDNGLSQLNETLAPEDRARLNNSSQGASALKQQVDQLRQSWKDKYGSDFDIKNDQLALAQVQIQGVGQLDEARLAGERNSPERSQGLNPNSSGQSSGMDNRSTTQPSDATGSDRGQGGSQSSGTSPRSDAGNANTGGSGAYSDRSAANSGNSSDTGTQANRSGSANGTAQGMNMATAIIPQGQGLPQVNVNLVRESGDRWCIDLPDSVDAQQLQDNLVRHLTMINQDKSSWPADANDAYLLVSHHVMAALTDTNTGSSSSMR